MQEELRKVGNIEEGKANPAGEHKGEAVKNVAVSQITPPRARTARGPPGKISKPNTPTRRATKQRRCKFVARGILHQMSPSTIH